MKTQFFLLFLALITYRSQAQQLFQPFSDHQHKGDYIQEWIDIDSLYNHALLEKAVASTDALYSRALKEKNKAQIVKSILYQCQFIALTDENAHAASLAHLQKKNKELNDPALEPLFISLQAELLERVGRGSYFRSKDTVAQFDLRKYDTWNKEELATEAKSFFEESIALGAKTTPTSQFKDLLYEYDTLLYYPYLYDLLMERYLSWKKQEYGYAYIYWREEETDRFYLDARLVGPIDDFLEMSIPKREDWDEKQEFRFYQKWLNFHQKGNNPNALIYINLRRLSLGKENAYHKDKEDAYRKALEEMIQLYPHSQAVAEVYHMLASKYLDNIEAIAACEKVIEKWPNTYFAFQCKKLAFDIREKRLTAHLEQNYPIDQPILTMLYFKNTDSVYLRLLEMTPRLRHKIAKNKSGETTMETLGKHKKYKAWSEVLPKTADFDWHSTELSIPPQEQGKYLLLYSVDPSFDFVAKSNIFLVSDMVPQFRQKEDTAQIILVDRTSGKPMEDVKAQIKKYASKKKRSTVSKITSNKNGELFFPREKHGEYSLKLKSPNKEKLTLEFPDLNYSFHEAKSPIGTQIFTDRAIYRPGQPIYFKGLLLGDEGVIADSSTMILLRNPFGEIMDTLRVTTNEYGSYSGTFQTKKNWISGTYRLEDGYEGARIRLEDYKRPTFTTKLLEGPATYFVGDTVKIKGIADAYSGYPLVGAKVNYTVFRRAKVKNYSLGLYNHRLPGDRVKLLDSTTIIDANGAFEISFIATADSLLSATTNCTYHYTIKAVVIDISGETKELDQLITTTNDRKLSIEFDDLEEIMIAEAQEKTFNIKDSKKLPLAVNGTVTISRLQAQKAYAERYWSAPDQPLMSKEEFATKLPAYSYDQKAPAVAAIQATQKFSGSQATISIQENWPSGLYKIAVEALGPNGEKGSTERLITIVNRKENKLPYTAVFWHHSDEKTVEPGEEYHFEFGSAHKEAWILFELFNKKEVLVKEWIKASEIIRKTIKIKEEHQGGLEYQLTMVKNNRQYAQTYSIQVPFYNKDIRFEYLSFRDKLEPGQEEEWKIKLIGPKGATIAAEMLANMYDASLDEFMGHNWNPSNYRMHTYGLINFENDADFKEGRTYKQVNKQKFKGRFTQLKVKPSLFWYGFPFSSWSLNYRKKRLKWRKDKLNPPQGTPVDTHGQTFDSDSDGVPDYEDSEQFSPPGYEVNANGVAQIPPPPSPDLSPKYDRVLINGLVPPLSSPDFSEVKVRTELQETAFFFPHLRTDKEGNISINFKMTEALTRWKFMAFAHTKDYKYGISTREIVTQKKLMISPNTPRFLREGDEILFTAKVTNLTENQLNGRAKLELLDALTREPVDIALGNIQAVQSFIIDKNGSTSLSWKLTVPSGQSALTYRVIAKAGDYADGEENTIPVLSNRALVMETLPLSIRGKETKQFTFKGMQKAKGSTTLSHHRLTLEFTENPAWYAIQGLPYLMEYPHECTEQLFSRYFANALASNLVATQPRIAAVFEQWKNTEALVNNLLKNPELKASLLEESPWVLEAKSQEERTKRLGLIFDLNKMAGEQATALEKIQSRQLNNGAFPWFPDGHESEYFSRYIVQGFGQLDRLGVQEVKEGMKGRKTQTGKMLLAAIAYLDKKLVDRYKMQLREIKTNRWLRENKHRTNYVNPLPYSAIHYLYMRSFFLEQKMDAATQDAVNYYLNQGKEHWKYELCGNNYMQGLLALSLHRMGDTETPKAIIKNLRQTAIVDEDMGMYWEAKYGYHWYNMPTETHTLLMEVFAEIAQDDKTVENLKIWLLKNKQSGNWKTTKATTAAIYALLMKGDNWLLEDNPVEITVGNEIIDTKNIEKEAGTGNFKKSWEATEIKAEMANIKVKNNNKNVAWGSLNWQYFERMDKIIAFEGTPLKLQKEVLREENTATGTELKPVTASTILAQGDKLIIRIHLTAEQQMEYLHLKDLRGSGLEPIDVISKYEWSSGIGHYKSTRDLATHFFIDRLPAGTYTFEYALRVNLKGEFSNGIAKIQSMYAPEFTSFSGDLMLRVK